jgi:hypothetical protein
VACSNGSDPRILDAAESLVPPQSQVNEVVENTEGFSFESGPYVASYKITDGGLGVVLVDAIEEQAIAEGWELRDRDEGGDAINLSFVREDLEALVYVWVNRDPVDASITVNKAR